MLPYLRPHGKLLKQQEEFNIVINIVMTKLEGLKIQLNELMTIQQNHTKSQDEFNKKLLANINEISRGLYGDLTNKTPGVINALFDLSTEVAKNSFFRRKLIWLWSILFIVGQGLGFLIMEKVFIHT